MESCFLMLVLLHLDQADHDCWLVVSRDFSWRIGSCNPDVEGSEWEAEEDEGSVPIAADRAMSLDAIISGFFLSLKVSSQILENTSNSFGLHRFFKLQQSLFNKDLHT